MGEGSENMENGKGNGIKNTGQNPHAPPSKITLVIHQPTGHDNLSIRLPATNTDCQI